jgi:drug/metabolite transporter (DMT)-like permease
MAILGLDSWFKLALFFGYMSLWISQGILVHASRDNGTINYNFTTVALITEFVKLLISLAAYLGEKGNTVSTLCSHITANAKIWLLYFIPALLYCVYNNLTFVNLEFFDPPTYFILSQFKLVITGILYQFLFKKKLSGRQWASLCVLTVGCISKELHKLSSSALEDIPIFNWGLVLVQMLCSVFAGVYTELLLKGNACPVHVQNVFMYIDSIIGNIAILSLGIGGRNLSDAMQWENLGPICNMNVLLIIANSACVGIATAMFLKYLNSMLKAVASALEIVGTALVSYVVFGTDLGPNTALSVGMVAYGVYLYSVPAAKNSNGDNRLRTRSADIKD